MKYETDLLVPTDDQSLSMLHPEHGEAYHARLGARTEATFLYIEGSKITDYLDRPGKKDCSVLDLGLGLGYNALATIKAWQKSSGNQNLNLVSFEIDAALVASLLSGNAPWQSNWSEEELSLLRQVKSENESSYFLGRAHPHGEGRLNWQINIGDALNLIATWQNKPIFNFIWQDAFSPATCPSLWQNEWFLNVYAACDTEAVLMTYSVAAVVKKSLTKAGWKIEKIKGVGSKRQWLRAYKSELPHLIP